MATLKRGKASKKDLDYIAANSDQPVAEIAATLRRSEDFVRKYIAAQPTFDRINEHGDWVSRLHTSSFWPEVRRGLVGGEVSVFEQSWASYMSQFGSTSDIMETDNLMIKDLVMLDILCQRAINDKANTIRRLDVLEQSIDIERQKDEEDRDQVELQRWMNEKSALLVAKTALSKEHIDYQQRKDTKLRDLKGSRDQRFKTIQESKRNIFELIKDLDSDNKRRIEGKLAEKVRIAAERVRDDWNQVMEFEDGTVDKPFVSPEGELEDVRFQNEQG